MNFTYNESTVLIIKALLEGDENVTALNGGRFLTTRISNHICKLREDGLEIETETLKTDNGKWFGRYKIKNSDLNVKKAISLLESIETQLSRKSKG